MIIKCEGIIDLFTNKLSGSTPYESNFNGLTALARLVLVQPWTVKNQKQIRILFNRSFFKKNLIAFMLIKDSNQSSLLIGTLSS